VTGRLLQRFTETHKNKYTWLPDLFSSFQNLEKMLLPHLEQEEQVIFPYIRQIAHAYTSKEPYAALLVRTLRKPLEDIMNEEDEYIGSYLQQCRQLTNNYALSPGICTTHRVCLLKLQELDHDLAHHIHLEKNILFPKALSIEKEMLA